MTGYLFKIVECKKCGLVFVNPRLNSDEITALYNASYFHGKGFDRSINYYAQELEWEACAAEHFESVLQRIAVVKPSPADVLEIGPGMGMLMRRLQDAGYQVKGLDISPFAVVVLRDQGFDVDKGVLPCDKIRDSAFDVVIAVEVIEHLLDPMSFFREVRRILKPGGIFYYETGNIACEEAIRLGAEWSYIMPEGHLYYFSPVTLSRYFKAAGFRLEYPYWYNPERRMVKLFRGVRVLGDVGIFPKGAKGAIARRIFAFLDRLFVREPFPLARKPES